MPIIQPKGKARVVVTPEEFGVIHPPDPLLVNPVGDYTLPIHVFESELCYDDEALLAAMQEYTPRTKLKCGDLVALTEIPPYVRWGIARIPRVWKIRFVVSLWAHELMALAHSYPGDIGGIDHAVTLMEEQNIPRSTYDKPIVYAHGFPHGMYPNTATWFPARVLKKIVLRESNVEWPEILDEAQTPFQGYDIYNLGAPFLFDLAPDQYSKGCNLDRPFRHEEATTQTACLLGLEEALMVPLHSESPTAPGIDPEHDAFEPE